MRKTKKKKSMAALIFIFNVMAFSIPLFSQDLKGTTPIEPPTEHNPTFLYKKSYALLIGIWDYMKGWERLSPENIENDLETVAKALKAHNFITKKVVNPTYKEIIEELNQFKNNYGLDKNNRLLFYFSGHGMSRHNHEIGYIVPKDAPFPDTWGNKREFLKRAVSMEYFVTLAKELESRHGLFIFDSCFSGTIFRTGRGGSLQAILEKKELPVRLFISSGKANQRVPEQSLFTRAFVEGIKGQADLIKDGFITGRELFEYIKTKVEFNRPDQNPQMGTVKVPGYDDEGEYIFFVNEPHAAHETSKKRKTGSKASGNETQKQKDEVNLLIRVYPYADVYINGKKLGEIPPQVIEKIREDTTYIIKLIKDQKTYIGEFVIEKGYVHWIKKIHGINVNLNVEK